MVKHKTWLKCSKFSVVQYEAKTRLERFSASASISSADLFDDPKKQTGKT